MHDGALGAGRDLGDRRRRLAAAPEARRSPAEARASRPTAIEEAIAEEIGRPHERRASASCGSARSPSWPAPRRGRSATTRRSACCPVAGGREPGAHRTYAEADVERLTELLRLKDLLGLSLEELKELVEAEGARAELRREWHGGVEDPVRRRQILEESLAYIARQLELVRRRRDEIAKLEAELSPAASESKRCCGATEPAKSVEIATVFAVSANQRRPKRIAEGPGEGDWVLSMKPARCGARRQQEPSFRRRRCSQSPAPGPSHPNAVRRRPDRRPPSAPRSACSASSPGPGSWSRGRRRRGARPAPTSAPGRACRPAGGARP